MSFLFLLIEFNRITHFWKVNEWIVSNWKLFVKERNEWICPFGLKLLKTRVQLPSIQFQCMDNGHDTVLLDLNASHLPDHWGAVRAFFCNFYFVSNRFFHSFSGVKILEQIFCVYNFIRSILFWNFDVRLASRTPQFKTGKDRFIVKAVFQ